MKTQGGIWSLASRFLPSLPHKKAFRYQFEKLHALKGIQDPASVATSILLTADLRPSDRVLDVGCAEGYVAIEIATRVAHVNGVELEAHRVEEARRRARERNVGNVSFATGSIRDYPVEPMSYDVILLLAVLGKKTDTGHIDLSDLERMLAATRRQIVLRLSVQKYSTVVRGISLREILEKMDACGFDGICFGRRRGGNLIIGNRRGTDAILGIVPPLVLVPAEHLKSHPCLREAKIGSLREFQ